MSKNNGGSKARYRAGPLRRPGGGGGQISSPLESIRRAYAAAVAPPDPSKAPSKPKTWAEMTEAELEEMRRLYERKP
jgi:hypothetical protein